jgi:DnaA family protein|tara:strand:+ start:6119 stop:6829 length:711 start_codon:yes stop_codon:yes gene_type:complete
VTDDLFMPQEQLLLPLQARHDLSLADIPPQAFASVLSALTQLMQGQLSQVYIWGEPGSGRSLLLSALMASQSNASHAVMLPLKQVVFMPVEMLDGLEQCPLVVLDDIDALRQWPEWQEAVFHFYNRMKAVGGRLLVTGAQPPADLPLGLADLRSRMAASSVYALPACSDEVRSELLAVAGARRSWNLGDDTVAYLLSRGPRRLGQFWALIEQLDKFTLQQKRPLTIPLIRECMNAA